MDHRLSIQVVEDVEDRGFSTCSDPRTELQRQGAPSSRLADRRIPLLWMVSTHSTAREKQTYMHWRRAALRSVIHTGPANAVHSSAPSNQRLSNSHFVLVCVAQCLCSPVNVRQITLLIGICGEREHLFLLGWSAKRRVLFHIAPVLELRFSIQWRRLVWCMTRHDWACEQRHGGFLSVSNLAVLLLAMMSLAHGFSEI